MPIKCVYSGGSTPVVMFKRDRAIVYGSNESKNLFINDTER